MTLCVLVGTANKEASIFKYFINISRVQSRNESLLAWLVCICKRNRSITKRDILIGMAVRRSLTRMRWFEKFFLLLLLFVTKAFYHSFVFPFARSSNASKMENKKESPEGKKWATEFGWMGDFFASENDDFVFVIVAMPRKISEKCFRALFEWSDAFCRNGASLNITWGIILRFSEPRANTKYICN